MITVKRILGIDPGSRITGFGVLDSAAGQARYRDSGCIRLPQEEPLAGRLKMLFDGIATLIEQHQPHEVAVEQVFVHRNADAALKLGQARGVVLCAAASAGLPISEYSPRAIKQAVVGIGQATKDQVQKMMYLLLGLSKLPQADAADALAVALCHLNTQHTQSRFTAMTRGRSP